MHAGTARAVHRMQQKLKAKVSPPGPLVSFDTDNIVCVIMIIIVSLKPRCALNAALLFWDYAVKTLINIVLTFY